MSKQTNRKTCPVWLGYGLNVNIRKIIHNPTKMVGKYIKPGTIVADIGTGMGYMTLPMAKMVGVNGKVLGVDIQEGMLAKVMSIAKSQKLDDRIEPIICKQNSLMLNEYEDTIGFALMFMMVHEVSDKQKLFADISGAMKVGGLLLIAEPKVHVGQKNFDETVAIALKAGFKVSIQKQKVNICRTIILEKI